MKHAKQTIKIRFYVLPTVLNQSISFHLTRKGHVLSVRIDHIRMK